MVAPTIVPVFTRPALDLAAGLFLLAHWNITSLACGRACCVFQEIIIHDFMYVYQFMANTAAPRSTMLLLTPGCTSPCRRSRDSCLQRMNNRCILGLREKQMWSGGL